MAFALTLLAAAHLGGAEPAAPVSQPEALYADGRYVEAADACSDQSDADCFAIAARATLVGGYFEADQDACIEAAKRAEDFAREALKRDPDHVEGHVQLGLALGRRGAEIAAVKAHLLRLAPRSRNHIERAVKLDPQNAWALAALGGWHLEVVRRGGARVYGASVDEGVAAFERALALAPENPAIAYQFGLRLAGLDDPELDAMARAAFARAAAGEPVSEIERLLKADAPAAAAALDLEGDARAFVLASRL